MIRKACLIAGFFCTSLFAEPPRCYWDIPKLLFQPEWVSEALQLHYISQSAWGLVNSTLQDRIQEVRGLVQTRARSLRPNPLTTRPFDSEGAAKIMRDTLYDIFRDTLNYHGITNESDIRDMFYLIERRHHDVLDRCLGAHNFIEHRDALIEYKPEAPNRNPNAQPNYVR